MTVTPARVRAVAGLAATLAAGGIALASCGGSGSGAKPGVTVATPRIEGGVQVFDVVGTKTLQFEPNTLDARPGIVRVNFGVEKQSAPHDFVVPSLPSAKTPVVDAGSKTSVTFTATRAGRYQFVCSIHANMQGALNVG